VKSDPRWGVIVALDALGTGEPKSDPEWRTLIEVRRSLGADAKLPPVTWRSGFFSLSPEDADKEAPSLDVTREIIRFSDTILFVYEFNRRPAIGGFAVRAVWRNIENWYVRAVLRGELYRGALAIGEFYRDAELVMGPAVNEAGKVYDEADWAGIVLTEPAGELMKPPEVTESPFAYTQWDVPLHQKPDESIPTKRMWTLCWPTRCQIVDDTLTSETFWNKVEQIFGRTSRAEVKRKRDNTKAYFDEMWKRGLREREETRQLAESVSRALGLK
jgi:hypothetical protein